MASQELRDAIFIGTDQRTNFKNVIAKRSDLVRFDGGRMVAGAALYEAGTVLGIVTASGLYKAYVSTATDGSQVAVGVLAEQASVDAAGNGSEIAVIKSGVLLKDLLIGLDSTAISALGGHVSVEHGTNLISINA